MEIVKEALETSLNESADDFALISVFLWAPFIIIAVWVAFEFNSLATRILQKRIAKKIDADIHEDEKIEEIDEEEC